MITLKASRTRIPADTLQRVACKGERVRIERRGAKPVYLVPEEDLKRIERVEDRYWAKAGRKALREFRKSGEKAIPWAELRAELGTSKE
jgi:PHD/YefM family antitoxin component YafN of YafNO toxin-antitoxin module